MSTADTLESPFFTSAQGIFSSQKHVNLLQGKAWDRFLELGLPEKSSELFKYFPLRKLYDLRLTLPAILRPPKEAIETHILPEAKESYLVFVGGRFSPELSKLPSRLVALPLQEAVKTYGPFLQHRLNKSIKEEKDSFSLLNLALQEEGLFCYLPPKVKLEAPLQILYYGEGSESYHPARLHLFCSAESELKSISTVVGDGIHHLAMDGAIEEKGSWSHIDISIDGSGVCLSDFKVTLKEASSLNYLAITTSSRLTRNRLRVSLMGERANVLLQGFWHLYGSCQSHTHVHVEHAAPLTTSLQKFKGILEGQSQSSFAGKIYIHPEAQKTEAYQLNHNLLLSEGALANARPNLEIFADDVKASHGATVSRVDEQQLFYLLSRGITRAAAKELLVRGFIQEVLDQIPYPSLLRLYEPI